MPEETRDHPRPTRDAARQARLAYLTVTALSRLGQDVFVLPDTETGELAPGPEFRPADLIVQHLDVRLRLILLLETSTEADLFEASHLRAAALVLRHWPETTAVGLVANDTDLPCLIVEPFDVEPTIAAPSGEALPPTPRRMPLRVDLAVREYLDVVVPSWENVPGRIASEPFHYEEVAREVSNDVGRVMSDRRANIDEKRAALDSISRSDMTWVARLVERAVSRGLTPEEIANEVTRRAGRT